MASTVTKCIESDAKLIIGSHIVPVTWVHGFAWKTWLAGLARDAAMFQRPCQIQPKQSPVSQAWILPVFVERGLGGTVGYESGPDGLSQLGIYLTASLTHVMEKLWRGVPADVAIHPLIMAAHQCWQHAKVCTVVEWAKLEKEKAQATGRVVRFEEGPSRGSVQMRDRSSGKIVSQLDADASFPIDNTQMAMEIASGLA